MDGRSLSLILMFVALAAPARAQQAVEPTVSSQSETATTQSPVASRSLVVLRNGEVLEGQISRDGDRTIVSSEGAEIRLSPREVDFTCQTLDEAYTIQHNRVIAGRIEDHLNLADWCLRHQLLGYAAREITSAMQLDAKNPRVTQLDGRLRRALVPEPMQAVDAGVSTAARPVPTDQLERLVRSLPPGTVESFTATVQPMLLNYCATAGCHGPSSQSQFTLSRAPLEKFASRRLTERNLYNTLQWIDHDSPIDSKLLSAAREPHGPNQASGATGVGTAKYQELVSWVLQASPNTNFGPSNIAGRGGSGAPAAAGLPVGTTPVLASPSPATVLVSPNVVGPASKAASSKLAKGSGAAAPSPKSNLPSPRPTAANPPVEQTPAPAVDQPEAVPTGNDQK
jgi:hypothetical protein